MPPGVARRITSHFQTCSCASSLLGQEHHLLAAKNRSRCMHNSSRYKGKILNLFLAILAPVTLFLTFILLILNLSYAFLYQNGNFYLITYTFLLWIISVSLTLLATSLIQILQNTQLKTFLVILTIAIVIAALLDVTHYTPSINTTAGPLRFETKKQIFIAVSTASAAMIGTLQAAGIRLFCMDCFAWVKRIRLSTLLKALKALI